MTVKTAHAKPAAKRVAAKPAADSYAAKRRLLSEKLKTLREESEALSVNASQMLRRFSAQALAKDEIDDLIAAVATVDVLKNTIADQSKLIAAILTELDQLRARMTAIETKPAKPA